MLGQDEDTVRYRLDEDRRTETRAACSLACHNESAAASI